MKVSARYLEGIKEGRNTLNIGKELGEPIPEWLASNLALTKRLLASVKPLANSALAVDFFQGEIDFYENQLKTA